MPLARQIAAYTLFAVVIATGCLLLGVSLAKTFLGMAASSALGLITIETHRSRAVERQGWRYLTPGFTEWFAFVGCAAFALLMVYVYFFGGSARPDAARQMVYVLWIMIGFGAAGLYCGIKIAFEITRWNDDELQHRTVLLQVRTIPLDLLDTARYTRGGHALRVTGLDGTRIDIPLHRNGVDALLKLLEDRAER